MRKLLLASTNKGKLRELQALLADEDWQILSLADYPDYIAPEETGDSFAENALLKARAAAAYTGLITLADDSGLTVDFLGGAPGINSARYAGEGCSSADCNSKLLKELKGTPRELRKAAFICVIAVVLPGGGQQVFCGRLQGLIAEDYAGEGGFGYDPLFYLPHYDKTVAQLSAEQKNKISHRARALAAAKEYLRGIEEI